ncbi:HPr family phosphocarrier protein [Fastidiosibacter lacustris]|uniref:HPr family phosphocarrier protein n=1 Tax=Fastidiosibacter lacustris TaxID=2056695 RepID=UPI000E34798D|nr:HPr family phosphocarrier protein [Fastidiosibacter lacustris]
MKEVELVIINQLGLHARAASKLVNLALRFSSDVYMEVVKTGVKVNCKSIMGLMMLGASCGTSIIISAEGEDAQEALDSIRTLIQDRFGEES